MTLGFEVNGRWDVKGFTTDYELFINGLPVLMSTEKGIEKGLYDASPGRVDVYLKRADGHSLSDRIELDKEERGEE